MARVLADDASVFDMTGVSEDDASGSKEISFLNAIPTVVSRASPLTFTTGSHDMNGTIKIYDIRGQLIKDLMSGSDNTRIVWQLVDESGKRVPAGVYLIRFESGNNALTRKLVIAD